MSQRSLIIGLAVIITISIVAGILLGTGKFKGIKTKSLEVEVRKEASQLLSPKDAYEIALAKARQWHQDAVLSQSSSAKEKTDELGHSDDWQFLFVSESIPKRGYQIVMERGAIVKAQEVPFVGEGAQVPQDLISQQEAIAYVHSLKGYENQPTLSIEMYYNKDANEWRWGIKTPKGTVSFKASR